jgi:hypothetical protein
MGMAIKYHTDEIGKTMYAYILNSSGSYFAPLMSDFVTFVDEASHKISLTEDSQHIYRATAGEDFVTDMYLIKVYKQLGGSADIDVDLLMGDCVLLWDSSEQREIKLKDIWDKVQNIPDGGDGGGSDDISQILAFVKELVSRKRNG